MYIYFIVNINNKNNVTFTFGLFSNLCLSVVSKIRGVLPVGIPEMLRLTLPTHDYTVHKTGRR